MHGAAGQVSTFDSVTFVEAARLSGESDVVILVREILPNMASLLLSAIIGATIYAIGAGWLRVLGWETSVRSLGAPICIGQPRRSLELVHGDLCADGFVCGIGGGFALTLLSFVDELTNPRLASERHWVRRLGQRWCLAKRRCWRGAMSSTPVLEVTDLVVDYLRRW